MNVNAAFDWKCQPQAEQLLLEVVERAVQVNPFIAKLSQDLLEKTSTRLFDWLDHVVILSSEYSEGQLQEVGFILQDSQQEEKDRVYYHPGAQLPRIVMKNSGVWGLAVAVDRITDFILARGGSTASIEGTPFGQYRTCCFNQTHSVCLWVIERRGTLSIIPSQQSEDYIEDYLKACEKWSRRSRSLPNQEEAMRETLKVAQEIIDLVGNRHLAAWIILECERSYWQNRNTAAQLQKNRQDRLGMGWANHDHHTFRSSRKFFKDLVHLFEMLGFSCRERFYAGQEAGWGAQVMENPVCKLVLFLDVDLAAHEIEGDFAHQQLPELERFGTIGLWCALHGDSILNSGMHHLEAQFMFDELTHDLDQAGIKMMHPFSSFPYLKQAFTAGEIWPVSSEKIELLLKTGKITEEQATKFLTQGALGSHLENLQRREGYKGFNQKNVSIIIKKTDPRHT